VDRVIAQTTLDYRPNLRKLKPDYFVHGTDWRSGVMQAPRQQAIDTIKEWGGKLVEPKYTEDISSTAMYEKLKASILE
jgi:bifunctional ADP-heptose synthase (sugar kinase/adenylyltransferase)